MMSSNDVQTLKTAQDSQTPGAALIFHNSGGKDREMEAAYKT